ncbi:unannotated protein [freshwater metagenome]|uniref:Unannotated protein n=1 Tax=freshwater metagenome TaxID=449393 RepID=A0A6J7F9N7_9ZZZZ
MLIGQAVGEHQYPFGLFDHRPGRFEIGDASDHFALYGVCADLVEVDVHPTGPNDDTVGVAQGVADDQNMVGATVQVDDAMAAAERRPDPGGGVDSAGDLGEVVGVPVLEYGVGGQGFRFGRISVQGGELTGPFPDAGREQESEVSTAQLRPRVQEEAGGVGVLVGHDASVPVAACGIVTSRRVHTADNRCVRTVFTK